MSLNANLWRGIIDTRDPRAVMTATATGATYVNTADNTQRYEVCLAVTGTSPAVSAEVPVT